MEINAPLPPLSAVETWPLSERAFCSASSLLSTTLDFPFADSSDLSRGVCSGRRTVPPGLSLDPSAAWADRPSLESLIQENHLGALGYWILLQSMTCNSPVLSINSFHLVILASPLPPPPANLQPVCGGATFSPATVISPPPPPPISSQPPNPPPPLLGLSRNVCFPSSESFRPPPPKQMNRPILIL